MNERTKKISAYAVLYLVWGSTYLAVRFALETLPPFALAAARFLVAGAILFAFALLRGEPLPSKRDWGRAIVVGALLLVVGNGSVVWAVQHVPSGVAALLIATTPIWLALFLGKRPSARTIGGMLLGLVGVAVLVGPAAFAGSKRIDPKGVLALVIASMAWAAGSLIQRAGKGTSPLLGTGCQMLTGGAMLVVIAACAGELPFHLAAGSLKSFSSLAYLVVFGSLLGFTSYAWLMRHDEPTRVATYSYVNPVIAVLLGALLAGEELSARVMMAAAVIVTGVAVIVSERR